VHVEVVGGADERPEAYERRAVALQITRRSARHETRLAQLARNDVLRTGWSDAHAEVEAFLDQVDDAIGERHIEAHRRVRGHERGNRRRYVAHAEIHRRGELDRAAGHHRCPLGLLLGLSEVREKLDRPLIERAARLGQAHPPGSAVQKPGLQVRLQVGDMARRRSGGQAELARRAGKAPTFNHL